MMAQDFGLPPSVYPKAYFARGKYPNIFRDDQKHRLDGVVFANVDYFHKDAPKVSGKSYVELCGGLTHRLSVPWNYPQVTDEELVLEQLAICEKDDVVFKPDYPLTDVRCHIRFMSCRRHAYVPFMEPVISVPSAVGNQIVGVYRCFTKPDYYFIKDTQQGLMMAFNNRKSCSVQLSSMTINPGLVNLKLLTSEVKDATIRHLGKTIRNQHYLEKFSYENGFLCRTDAIRILIGVALGAGHILEKIYLPYLFCPSLLPIENESEYLDVYNEFEYDGEKIAEFSEEAKAKTWTRLLEFNNFDALPSFAVDKYFLMSLRSLSNLTVLMVNYTWFSKGNGLYLLNLESIRNGKLRKLILLLTPIEQPTRSKQVICHKAWSEAVKLCPELELHLVLGQNASEIDLNKVMMRSMPLASFHFSTVYPMVDLRKQKTWSFSYVTRYLRSYFRQTLKMITFEVWHPGCRVDVALANLILQCPLLREFVFKGNIDRMESIHAICEFLVENQTLRLRRLEFWVIDDPCRPVGWTEAIKSIKDKYQTSLALKGITFALGIWKI